MGGDINDVLSGLKASVCHDKFNQVELTCIYILKFYLSLLGDDVAVSGVNWSVSSCRSHGVSVSFSMTVFYCVSLFDEECRQTFLCQEGLG